MRKRIVIIGGGQAGLQAAISLRSEGYEDDIIILAEEKDYPYQKPTLSKEFLLDKFPLERIALKPEKIFINKSIDLRLGQKVIRIDPKEMNIELADGQIINYHHLILATGASNRLLKVNPDVDAQIHYLRTLQDCLRLKKSFATAHRIAIIGGGFIGLEIAAAARSKNIDVDLIELQGHLMSRALPSVISEIFEKKHTSHGVKLHLNTGMESMKQKSDSSFKIDLSNGKELDADLIIAGIGVLPNDSLAKAADLNCSNGIEIDEYCRTSHANIYAIGDCAFHFNKYMQQSLRLESIQNAMDQGMTVASTIMGKNEAYDKVPWFWSNQYDLKLQMAGYNQNYDHYFVRGNREEEKCSYYYFKDHRLIGVDSINRGGDHMAARKLIKAGISPSKEQIEDLDFKLKQLIN